MANSPEARGFRRKLKSISISAGQRTGEPRICLTRQRGLRSPPGLRLYREDFLTNEVGDMKGSRAVWMMTALLAALLLPVAAPAQPSFDCARVTSSVNRMVCASPALSAADRKLADDFNSMRGQGGVDTKALQTEEDDWLRNVRGRCADQACLAKAYAERDAALRDKSMRAASPVAYDETRPFPVAPDLWSAAQSLIGHDCTGAIAHPRRIFTGFDTIKGWLPVLHKGRFVMTLERGETRLAFLLEEPDVRHCRIADVVTLPAKRPREAFLQCSLQDAEAYGFGMRQDGRAKHVGFWSIEPGKIVREPLDVLGGKLICNQPETGE
jgi:uncharacterized protein